MKYLLAALMLMSTIAMAQPNQDHTCQGGHNCNEGGGGTAEQTQEQGQSQESYNANLNANYNENTSFSESSSASNADSSSNSAAIGVGGDSSANSNVDASTRSTATGGSSNATGGDGGNATASGGAGGDSSSVSEVGDTTAVSGDSVSTASNGGNSTGDVAVSVQDNRVTDIKYEQASARAASVYAQVCQSGGSAQGQAGGFAVTNQDVLCDHLKVAAVMREAYIFELQYGDKTDCFVDRGGYSNCEISDKAVEYRDAYHESLNDAMKLMDATEEAGMLDKIGGYLIRPAALIGALIWLI